MKKLLLLVLFVVGMTTVKAQFSGGNGTDTLPFLISTPQDLDNIRRVNSKAIFRLVRNIDLSDYIDQKYGEEGWLPIENFYGEFHGYGYKITGLWINRPCQNFVGLFGKTEGSGQNAGDIAYIGHLFVEGKDDKPFAGREGVGMLVGYSQTTLLRNCHVVTGKNQFIQGISYVGGVTGSHVGAMQFCSSKAGIVGHERVGGLAGQFRGTMFSCYTNGIIYSTGPRVGGMIGETFLSCDISYCYVANKMLYTPNSYIGSIIGNPDYTINAEGILYDHDLNGYYLIPGGDGQSLGATAGNTWQMKNGEYPQLYIDIIHPPYNNRRYVFGPGFEPDCFHPRPDDKFAVYRGLAYPFLTFESTHFDPNKAVELDTYFDTVDVESKIDNLMLRYNCEIANRRWNPANYAGSGTINDPYQIKTANDLDNLRRYTGYKGNSYFRLMNNIDLGAYISSHSQYQTTGWKPIGMGEDTTYFVGNFEGNNKKITGFWSNMPNKNGVGIFNTLGNWNNSNEYNYIADLTIEVDNRGIQGDSAVGVLAGSFYAVDIFNCHSYGGPVNGNYNTGGLLGYGHNATSENWNTSQSNRRPLNIGNCSSSNNVSGNQQIGGLMGKIIGSILVEGCYSTGNVVGENRISGVKVSNIGGFIGLASCVNYNIAHILYCYSTGNVNITDAVNGFIPAGGFIGDCRTRVSDCYSHGNVYVNTNSQRIAGGSFIGWFNWGTINNCYSTGTSTNSKVIDSIDSPEVSTFVNNCYNDVKTSGISISNSLPFIGKSTGVMLQQNTFSEWDFNSTWKINENCSYPVFQWQPDDTNCVNCFAAGKGTEGDPFIISNPDQLDCFIDHAQKEENIGMHYRIISNIDVYQYIDDNYRTGWRGNELQEFNGYLHGGGHIISGIWSYHNTSETVGGLFSGIGMDGIVDSLGVIIDNKGVIALDEVGGFVGKNEGEIFSCFVMGGNVQSLNGNLGTGGLVGANERGYITNCYSNTTLMVSPPNEGYTGGLVGTNTRGRIEGSYSAGAIIAPFCTVGALVGYNYNTTNNNIGYNYFDIERCMRSNAIGTDNRTNNRNYGLSTAQMKDINELEEFDFEEIWKIVPGSYPILQWQDGVIVPLSMSMMSPEENNLEFINNETVLENNIYPNPTTNIVTIETADENPSIKVFDASNNLIITTTNKTIDLSSYKKGVYIFDINGRKEKVIKQ